MRFKFPLIATLVAAVALASASIAAAGDNGPAALPDPQTTNVPYLAWNGEELRLTKCEGTVNLGNSTPAQQRAILDLFPGRLIVEDWSGLANFKPQFENTRGIDGQVESYFGARGDGTFSLCWTGNIVSLKPGLAVIKLVVDLTLLPDSLGGDITIVYDPKFLKHQFLAIWMNLSAPTIVEPPTAGSPDGVNYNPPFSNGRVKINVEGNFPMGNNFADLLDGDPNTVDTVVLPRDYAALARWMAVDGDNRSTPGPNQGPGPVARWDIHDDQLATEGHSGLNNCLPRRADGIDAVDNCAAPFGELGAFSNLFGFTNPTIGPFDPLHPRQTLLSDGKVDAGDAQLTPARIDVRLAAGSAGALEEADKHVIYSRDGLGTASPHNIYAPFNATYIPATARGGLLGFPATSGTDTAFINNNFPSYLVTGLYHYWDFALEESVGPGRGGLNACNDPLGNPYPTPRGADHVVVYTDEHGEAWVEFNPNVGFFLDEDNNRCDLAPGLIGTAAIQAESKYPAQPVFQNRNGLSNILNKNIHSLASKELDCIPKGTNEAFCVETIRDIQGRPIANAPVQFSRTPRGNIDFAALQHGPYDTRGSVLVSANQDQVTVRTNSRGQAGVLVTESLDICVDVKAENLGTQFRNDRIGLVGPTVKRFAVFNPFRGIDCAPGGANPGGGGTGSGGTGTGGTGTGGTGTGGTGTGGTGTGGTGGSGSAGTTGTEAVIVSLAGAPKPAAQRPATKAPAVQKSVLRTAKLVTLKGNRYLVVRVNGSASTAKLKIRLVMRSGKIANVTRTVRTNRVVRIANLKVNKQVRTVRVSLAS